MENVHIVKFAPPHLPPREFEQLHFIPDPMLGNDGKFKSFDELYGTMTTDSDRPSLKDNPQPTERGKKFKGLLLLVAAKARNWVSCRECVKRRVVYSANKLSRMQKLDLIRLKEELIFVEILSFPFPVHISLTK